MALSEARRWEIEQKAGEVFENFSSTVPTKLVLVVSRLGFELKEYLPDLKTQQIFGGVNIEKKMIYINNKDTIERKRFMLAHQIGHALLHGVTTVDGRNIEMPEAVEDFEANFFARCLLMPASFFMGEWQNAHQDADILAAHFKVTSLAVRARSKDLGLA